MQVNRARIVSRISDSQTEAQIHEILRVLNNLSDKLRNLDISDFNLNFNGILPVTWYDIEGEPVEFIRDLRGRNSDKQLASEVDSGTLYWAIDTGDVTVSDGSTWIEIGNVGDVFTGEPGEPGEGTPGGSSGEYAVDGSTVQKEILTSVTKDADYIHSGGSTVVRARHFTLDKPGTYRVTGEIRFPDAVLNDLIGGALLVGNQTSYANHSAAGIGTIPSNQVFQTLDPTTWTEFTVYSPYVSYQDLHTAQALSLYVRGVASALEESQAGYFQIEVRNVRLRYALGSALQETAN